MDVWTLRSYLEFRLSRNTKIHQVLVKDIEAFLGGSLLDKSFIGVLKKRLHRFRFVGLRHLLEWDRAQAWLDKPREYTRNQGCFKEKFVEDYRHLLPRIDVGSPVEVSHKTRNPRMASEDGDAFIPEVFRKRKMDKAGLKILGLKNITGKKSKIDAPEKSVKDKDIEIVKLRNELKENEALLESANTTIFTIEFSKKDLLKIVQNQAKEIGNLEKQNLKLHEDNNILKCRIKNNLKTQSQLVEDETYPTVSLTKLVPKDTNDLLEKNMNYSDIEDMRLVLEMDDEDEDTEDDSLLSSLSSPLSVTCPLCAIPFLTKEQEQHAASCQGVEELLLLELSRQEVQEIVQMQEHEKGKEDIPNIIEVPVKKDVPDIVQKQEELRQIEQIKENYAADNKDLMKVQDMVLDEMQNSKSLKRVRFSFEAIDMAESPGRRSREELHLLARRSSVRQTGY